MKRKMKILMNKLMGNLIEGTGGILGGAIFVIAISSMAMADDTEIYFPSAPAGEPNVVIVLSNANSMAANLTLSNPYDPAQNYPQTSACNGQPCVSGSVYKYTGNLQGWSYNAPSIAATGFCASAQTSLSNTGLYTGKGGSSCKQGGSFNYGTGNYINWANQTGGGSASKISIAQTVLDNIVSSTYGVRLGLMVYDGPNAGIFPPTTVSGSTYTPYVNDMDAAFTTTSPAGTTTNRYALIDTINSITATNSSAPMAETLWEADQYFKGATSAFNKISGNYPSPLLSSCQKNYVIFISDGYPTADRFTSANPSFLTTGICDGKGDCDNDKNEPNALNYGNNGTHYVDDVAKYIHDNKLNTVTNAAGITTGESIKTFTIGLGGGSALCPSNTATDSSQTALLCRIADDQHGDGDYYYADSAQLLSEAIRKILVKVLEANSSFVAPVVPVSPDNKSTSGNYVYMGFFKPTDDTAFWDGNLKKYKIDNAGIIYDVTGATATYVDPVSGFTYFKSTAKSYWSANADGGNVDAGGSGAVLQARTLSTRLIYTYLPGVSTTTTLSNTNNAFTGANPNILPSTLNVSTTTDKNNLINFIYGYDAYGNNTASTREWIMGDVLHSRPLVIAYNTYTVTDFGNGTGSVFDCTQNKSLIYVGSNDGMLHAFKDCDGSEAWSFIPPDQLSNLHNIATGAINPGSRTFYYVDSSPRAYINDANGDGNITPGASGDQAVVIFGERRGGPYYYALDVTDSANPKFLWQLNLATLTGCPGATPSGTTNECGGLSFSEPSIGKISLLVNNVLTTKNVFFIGGGYDTAEDSRNTATQTYSGTVGRGVFAFDVLTGTKVWEYSKTANSDPNMNYPFPSEMTVFDSNNDGYLDTIYVGDTGGQMWKFNVMASTTTSWTASRVFNSNDIPTNGTDVGRKIFYPPDVTIETAGYNMLFLGTGDREHPKSTAVIDRLYGIQDRASTLITEQTPPALVDATTGTVTLGPSDYGWYIKLNTSLGEKVLSGATVFNRVAYYTTYIPAPLSASDPCDINLGSANLWAVGYLNAAAVLDLNKDGSLTTVDRKLALGSGIPSGVVIGMGTSGDFALIGSGGSVINTQTSPGGRVIPLYWRERR
ncbi:MAG: pilus assembly protein [Nitrospiria bacterium]